MDLKPENTFLDVIVKEEYAIEDIPERVHQKQWEENHLDLEQPEDVKNVILLENRPQGPTEVEGNECQCSICGKYYANRYVLKTHMGMHSSKKRGYSCPYCTTTMKRKTRLQIHIKTCHECQECKLFFRTRLEKASHIEQEHKIEELNNSDESLGYKKSFPCDKCGRIFVYEKTLKSHLSRFTQCQDKTLTCAICSQSFDVLFNLTTHVREMHTPLILSICSFCGMSFISNAYLNKHLLTHKKTYKCRYCNEEFGHKDERRDHRKNVHFYVNYRTNTRSFQRETDLKHRKNYECPYCLKKYATKDYFKNHVKSHKEHDESNYPYKEPVEELLKCEYCSKEIRGHAKLKRHKTWCRFSKKPRKNISKTINDNYICPICNYTCDSSKELFQHLPIHNIDLNPQREGKTKKKMTSSSLEQMDDFWTEEDPQTLRVQEVIQIEDGLSQPIPNHCENMTQEIDFEDDSDEYILS